MAKSNLNRHAMILNLQQGNEWLKLIKNINHKMEEYINLSLYDQIIHQEKTVESTKLSLVYLNAIISVINDDSEFQSQLVKETQKLQNNRETFNKIQVVINNKFDQFYQFLTQGVDSGKEIIDRKDYDLSEKFLKQAKGFKTEYEAFFKAKVSDKFNLNQYKETLMKKFHQYVDKISEMHDNYLLEEDKTVIYLGDIFHESQE